MYAWVLGNFVPGEAPHHPYTFGASDAKEEEAELSPNSSEATFGPFADIFVLVAHVEDLESHMTRMEMLKEMEVWEKAGWTQPGEASVAYAIKQTVPALFSKGTADRKVYMPEGYENSGKDSDRTTRATIAPGVKQKIETHCEQVEKEIRDYIHRSLTSKGLSVAATLAREMMRASFKFLSAVSDYMTTTYRELTEMEGYKRPDAWLLTTQILARIFTVLASVRSARLINPASSKARNTARVLFALMKTHELMADYMKYEICDHPSVASEYVKFLATHAGFVEEEKISSSVKAMEEKVAKVADDLRQATQMAKSAQGTGEQLKKELARLAAKC
jgi:hypothetical protein